jgi:hypothetical protein
MAVWTDGDNVICGVRASFTDAYNMMRFQIPFAGDRQETLLSAALANPVRELQNRVAYRCFTFIDRAGASSTRVCHHWN